ncbi:tetratricopeptide repeat protein [Streptomyces qinzhouensis]|uniref:Tetratricopeptide repeat protein n=1 Tax=Streptomyces qinzhouensis TaxID=2599401 RepID=A0A5B8IP06_9ACTN|nr:tetratricopeptide repeat protein [Streptomyces qinzhouensis]QDY79309.1 tetratricopeptide repeat protein [Streptomyces qinzhouensis]
MATREPNTHLALLFRETGWTHRQFVQAVNRIGTERGTPTKYQSPSVSQWLGGYVPKESTRPLIREALARKLGRSITSTAAGFPPPSGGPENSDSTSDALIDLSPTNSLPQRRLFIGASLFSVAVSIPNWLDVVGRMESVRSGTVSRIGMSDVDMVAKMTDRFTEIYSQFGGRHSRPLAGLFLANTVAPYLRADATDDVRKAMMSAASFLSYLTGWMAVDEGLHGLAQEYYVKGLELAGASTDHLTYCHVLRGMSVQAADLGHGSIAVRLANAAAATSPKMGPRLRAFMAGQQAHSFAVAGERNLALRSIMETEKAIDVAESGPGPFGGYGPATLAYHTAQVRHAMGDISGSIESLELHFQLRGPSETQVSGIRFHLMLAERQLQLGHLEAACATWSEVLDKYPKIHSGRVDRQVKKISQLLLPYISNGIAREIFERSRQSSRVT